VTLVNAVLHELLLRFFAKGRVAFNESFAVSWVAAAPRRSFARAETVCCSSARRTWQDDLVGILGACHDIDSRCVADSARTERLAALQVIYTAASAVVDSGAASRRGLRCR
jgi:hypothetical protein